MGKTTSGSCEYHDPNRIRPPKPRREETTPTRYVLGKGRPGVNPT